MQQAIAQASTSTQDFLSTSINVQNQSLTVQTALTNFITQNIQNIITNTCIANATDIQNQTLVIGGIIRGNVNLQQDAQTTAISSCALQSLANTLAQNTALSTAVSNLDQQLASTQSGLTSVLMLLIVVVAIVVLFGGGKVLSTASNPKKVGLLLLGLVLLCVVGEIIYRVFFKKSSS